MKMIRWSAVIALFLLISGCCYIMKTQAPPTSGLWIDVRTPEEFNTNHLVGAVNIPYDQIKDRIHEVTQDKQQTIHCYCRSGRRSGLAVQSLKELGFEHVINEGGFQQLKDSGKQTVNP